MNRAIKIVLPLTVLVLLPSVAWANSGTPLMLAGALHLVFGNTIIGIVEGLILALLFHRGKLLCVAVMIAANYFSAWVGYVWFMHEIVRWFGAEINIYNVVRWLGMFIIISYLLTLLLEWPFVAFCFWRDDRWFRKSVLATLIVQTASYLVIFGWYWSVSRTSLLTDVTAVPLSQIDVPSNMLLYYVPQANDDVIVWDMGRNREKKVGVLPPKTAWCVLSAGTSNVDNARWDLVARAFSDQLLEKTILPNFALSESAWINDKHLRQLKDKNAVDFWQIPQYVPTGEKGNWKTNERYNLWGNLELKNVKDGRYFRVSLEVPFLYWWINRVAMLPNGQAVFQLGANQICILDAETRRVAILAKGRCPVVTLTDEKQ